MYTRTGLFTKGAGATSTVSGLPGPPRALLLWTTGATANDVPAVQTRQSIGMWANNFPTYAAPRGVSRWMHHFTGMGTMNGYAGQNQVAAGFSASSPLQGNGWEISQLTETADGFTVTWSGALTTGTMIHYLAIGGDDVKAAIRESPVSFSQANTVGYTYNITDLGFQPNTAFLLTQNFSLTRPDYNYNIGLGVVGGNLGQWAWMNSTQDQRSQGNHWPLPARYMKETYAIAWRDPSNPYLMVRAMRFNPGGLDLQVIESLTSTGQWNTSTYVMCIQGPATIAGVGTVPSTNINQDVLTKFRPDTVLFGGHHDPVDPTITLNQGAISGMGAIDFNTGDKHYATWWTPYAQTLLVTTTLISKGITRNDFALMIRDRDTWDRWATVTRTPETTGFRAAWAGGSLSGNDQNNPYSYGYLAFEDIQFKLSSYNISQSAFQPSAFGQPVPISMTMYGASDYYVNTFGNVGNIAQVLFNSSLSLAVRLNMYHQLSSAMLSVSAYNPLRLNMAHPLTSGIQIISQFLPSVFGRDGMMGSALFDMGSAMSVARISMSHPLISTVLGRSAFESRFKIKVPSVRPAGPDDIPGTVNLHPNPSAERTDIGWFPETAGSLEIAYVTDRAWDGAQSVKVTNAAPGEGIIARSFYGLEIKGLRPDGTARRVNGQLRLYADPGALIDVYQRVVYTTGPTQEGDHLRVTHPGNRWPAPYFAPAVQLDDTREVNYIEVVAENVSGVAISFYADGAQIEEDQGYGATHFAIGTYGGQIGTWSGVPHASMTTRQPIPLIIKGIGRGGEVIIEGKMYRATWDNRWLEDISDYVIDATVQMDTSREVTWSLDANFTYEGYQQLEENYDWLAPVLKVTYPDGTVREGQLGLYFLVPGNMTRGEYERSVQVNAFDPLWLLARQAFTGPVKAFGGVERMRVVRDILDGSILTGGDDGLAGRRYHGPNSGKSWKKAREWARKTERLGLVNEILESSAMYPLWSIHNGEMRWRKRGEDRMANRTPVRLWAANLPAGARVDTSLPRIATLKSEVVGAVKTTPEAADAFDEILIINDDPDTKRVRVRGRVKGKGKHQRVVRGRGDRRRVRSMYAAYVDDEATAAEIAAALADELSNRVEGVEISVLPDPVPNYCRETAELAIWDAYGDPVAVGKYEVLNVKWGFTPTTCLQTMKLSRVDDGSTEIIVTAE